MEPNAIQGKVGTHSKPNQKSQPGSNHSIFHYFTVMTSSEPWSPALKKQIRVTAACMYSDNSCMMLIIHLISEVNLEFMESEMFQARVQKKSDHRPADSMPPSLRL